MPRTITVNLQTITPIWSGDVDRASDQVRETGLMGSIRWWSEVLVRGLEAFACDPTGNDRCAFDEETFRRTGQAEDGLRDVCPTCRLFGCTGWSSKLRLVVTNGQGGYEVDLSRAGVPFTMDFFELKPTLSQERWLLVKAFWLIARYGSIGGKTPLKPPGQPDYGLVTPVSPLRLPHLTRDQVSAWLADLMAASPALQRRQEHAPPDWPDLRLFFFNDEAWLDLGQINEVMRSDPGGFLAGRLGVSKKVFSFQRGNRFWGYTRDERMLDRVLGTLQRLGIRGTRTGEEVLGEL